MAIAGDIVIKLAADFAQFAQGMDSAVKKLDEFGKAATQTGTQLDEFTKKIGAGLKALGIVTVVLQAVNEIKKLAAAAEAASLEAEKMAKQYGLTSEQVQALQIVSEKSGKSMEDLAKIGKQNAEWLDRVTQEAKEAGLVIDSQYTKAIKQAADSSEEFNRKMAVLFAPMVAGAKSWVAEALDRMKSDLEAVAQHKGLVDTIASVIRMLSFGGGAGAGQAFRIGEFEEALRIAKEAEAAAAQRAQGVPGYGVPQIVKDRAAAATKAREDAEIALAQERDRAAKASYGGAPTITIPPVTVTATKTGGGTSEDDSIEAQIKRYQKLKENADATYTAIQKRRNEQLDDVQRELDVQQKVADIVEKFAAKKVTIDDDQKKRLTDAVRANEQQRSINERLLRDAERAVDIEKRMSDGTEARKQSQEDLNRALATGRLSQEAYRRETVRTNEAIREATLQNKRYDDDLGSLAAGFQAAAERFARSNDLFSVGEQAFAGLTTAISDSLDVLVGKSEKSFGEIAYAFAKMIADMTMRAALSQVFSTILSAITASPNLAGQSPTDVGAWPARASGGPVTAGHAYTVGEQGPETFVPSANGRIIPNGANISTTGDVVVNIDMSGGKTEGAQDPTKALEFGRKLQVAIKDVIGNERRPGGMLYSRGSG